MATSARDQLLTAIEEAHHKARQGDEPGQPCFEAVPFIASMFDQGYVALRRDGSFADHPLEHDVFQAFEEAYVDEADCDYDPDDDGVHCDFEATAFLRSLEENGVEYVRTSA